MNLYISIRSYLPTAQNVLQVDNSHSNFSICLILFAAQLIFTNNFWCQWNQKSMASAVIYYSAKLKLW